MLGDLSNGQLIEFPRSSMRINDIIFQALCLPGMNSLKLLTDEASDTGIGETQNTLGSVALLNSISSK